MPGKLSVELELDPRYYCERTARIYRYDGKEAKSLWGLAQKIGNAAVARAMWEDYDKSDYEKSLEPGNAAGGVDGRRQAYLKQLRKFFPRVLPEDPFCDDPYRYDHSAYLKARQDASREAFEMLKKLQENRK